MPASTASDELSRLRRFTLKEAVDLAIIGSGFAGSLMALIARRLGYSVALVERGKHPRFAIGESSTPLANLLLEELTVRYDLPRIRPLTKWGTWRKEYPELTVGLKRGFSFYHHTPWLPFHSDPERRNQLLVAASPHDGIADTHWYRADFDALLAEEAQQAGAFLLDEAEVRSAEFTTRDCWLKGSRSDGEFTIQSRFVLDATGPRGALHRLLDLPEALSPNLPATSGFFTHFTGVRQWAELHPDNEAPPYPPDAAALHHVFGGGWIWVLRFENGVTSAGAALTETLANEIRAGEGESAWQRLLAKLPSVREQFERAQPVLPWMYAPRLSFLSREIVGRKWALLPSAAGFVDPLLSSGFPLTLFGIDRLARLLERGFDAAEFLAGLEDYAQRTRAELGLVERLVAALYASMNDFEVFRGLSLLYFAAASYSESARRLGRPQLAGELFLLGEHRTFAGDLRSCADQALALSRERGMSALKKKALLKQIHEAITPIDVAGLRDMSRRNWYPARGEDLIEAGSRLEASPGEIEALLSRSGFWQEIGSRK